MTPPPPSLVKTHSNRPIVIGEVLFDHFPDGSRRLGGAPFNVARHLQGLGQHPQFISAVGDDAEGHEILAAMATAGMDVSGIAIRSDLATGAVRVHLEHGSATYEILENRAWDALDASQLDLSTLPCPMDQDALSEAPEPPADTIPPSALVSRGSLLYHGSLIARSTHNAALLRRWRSRWPGAVLFDANLRAPWYSQAAIAELTDGCTWVKLNLEELAELADSPEARREPDPRLRPLDFTHSTPTARAYLARHRAHAMLLTAGADGATAITAHEEARVSPAPQPDPFINTVGAGDGCTAAFIDGLLRQLPLQDNLTRASHFAAAICQLPGATPTDSAFYRAFRW